jgi:hypothetical protein
LFDCKGNLKGFDRAAIIVNIKWDSINNRVPLNIIANYTRDKLELIILNVLPITGPNTIRAAITTIATITKIKAYSTSPWPFSFLENSIELHLLSCPEWENN